MCPPALKPRSKTSRVQNLTYRSEMREAGRADTCFWEEGSPEAVLPVPSEAEEGAGCGWEGAGFAGRS